MKKDYVGDRGPGKKRLLREKAWMDAEARRKYKQAVIANSVTKRKPLDMKAHNF